MQEYPDLPEKDREAIQYLRQLFRGEIADDQGVRATIAAGLHYWTSYAPEGNPIPYPSEFRHPNLQDALMQISVAERLHEDLWDHFIDSEKGKDLIIKNLEHYFDLFNAVYKLTIFSEEHPELTAKFLSLIKSYKLLQDESRTMMSELFGTAFLLDKVASQEGALKKLEQMANTDPLTELGSRRALDAQLKELDSEKVAIAHIDLDNFKTLNDTFGHEVGDQALKDIAKLLRHFVGKEGHVFRQGGDELVIIFHEQSIEIVRELLANILDAVMHGYMIGTRPQTAIEYGDGNRKVKLGASIGLATNQNEKYASASPQEILELADKCMYFAKQNGKSQIYFCAETDPPQTNIQEAEGRAMLKEESERAWIPKSFWPR